MLMLSTVRMMKGTKPCEESHDKLGLTCTKLSLSWLKTKGARICLRFFLSGLEITRAKQISRAKKIGSNKIKWI